MPSPKEGESKSDFVSRCMGDAEMVAQFPDQAQRAAVCNKYYTNPPKASETCDCGNDCCTEKVEADEATRDMRLVRMECRVSL